MVTPEEFNKQDTVEVVHEFSDDFRLVPATSTHGGIQPQGNFRIDFVIDNNPRTTKQTYKLKEDGRLGTPSTIELEDHITRVHQFGATISPADAFNIGCWMISEIIGEKVDEEDIRKQVLKDFELNSEKDEVEYDVR